MDLTALKISDLRSMLDKKELSAKELTDAYLDRIKAVDDKLESYITVTAEAAERAAEKAQEKINKGEASALCGIPLAIKDNICTDGVKTTCSSKMLGNFVPFYNATVMDKLENEGAVMLGKVSMDEFAMGGSTQTSAFKKTKNPYDLTRVPGGSSGGSAAAVSASLCAAALGSDTGGSIRQPSSFCGVTGLKPTYGRVSRYGLVAFASSLDQIGPIAKSAEDCAVILNAIAGYDPHDGTSSKNEVPDFTAKIGQDIKGMKIAVPKEFYAEGIDDEVRKAVLAAADYYKSLGAELVDSSNLSRFDGIKYGHRSEEGENFAELISNSRREGFGEEVKRRIMLGNYALSSGYYDAYYGKAMALKQKIREEYENIFTGCDVILTPTAPTVAYGVNENISDPAKMYQADICTVTVNIASLPGISTTCGYDSKGMPIGMSIIGKKWDEATIIQAADAFEKNFTRQNASL